MNELLAIIVIVLVCCAMFFAWLFSMATCPDRMVNLISGSSSSQNGSSSNGSSSASKELINTKFNDSPSPDSSSGGGASKASSRSSSTVSNFLSRLNSQRSGTSKKLSVVPEADEQLTVTSISQCRATSSSPQAPQQRATILPNSQCRIIMEEPRSRTTTENEYGELEERCVEDVIERRRRQLVEHQGGEWPERAATDPMTANVTPVPSRCPSKPSIAAEEMMPLCNGPLGKSAPAFAHIL